ncbi:MAG TPA: response regulator [Candidatus Eisenbergiella stercoravium]|nr:response regulator [Candidatus Eisenbergiella stercoravium]
MYRILIVDDEKIERNGIRLLLGRQGRELEIAEAVNGMDALKWLEENRADILLTDVKMPLMNGIGLLEQVSERYPDMKKLIFSGYGEFEYARQAMRFGVEEYILKPVDPEEFRKAMDKLFDALDLEREEKERKAAEGDFFRKYVLNAVVNGADMEGLKRRTEGFSLDFLNQYRRMMLLETGGDFFGSGDKELMDEMVREAQGVRFDYLNLNPQECVLFFTDEAEDWKELAGRLNAVLARRCGTEKRSYISVSSGLKDGTQIADRYQELELLMENRFYDLESRVYMAENEAESAEDVRLDDDTLMKQIRQDIRAKDMLSLKEHCRRLFLNYGKNAGFSQIYVKFVFASLLKLLYEAIPEKTERELDEEMDRLYRAEDMDQVHGIIEKNTGLLEKKLEKESGSVHREVDTVKRYIFSHYGEELSIEQLAEMVYLAPSYLSSLFKKETGQNLSKFIKACRMEKAREMLENTHEKIGGISEKVGYPNVSYFCQSFREYYGVSPQKYRDQGEGVGGYEKNQTGA